MELPVDLALCQGCCSLDLDKVFAGHYETPQVVTKLPDVPRDMLSSACPLCRLLAEAVHMPFSDSSLASYHETCYLCNNVDTEMKLDEGYYLFADRVCRTQWEGIGHSSVIGYLGAVLPTSIGDGTTFFKSNIKSAKSITVAERAVHSPAISVMQTATEGFIALKVGKMKEGKSIASYLGSIYPAFNSESKPAPARLVRPDIDWELLRSFLQTCQESHNACLPTKACIDIAGFRLINCITGRLEPATADGSYVALSYVWGQPDKSNDFKPSLDDDLTRAPLVILDAMIAVKEMGLVYLWVDRCCIKQDDIEILDDHLSKMHLIYQQAVFTIIAAAGTDSAYGLPGVSMRTRRPQAHATVEDRLLVSALEPYTENSKNVKWNTRAWTYQEGVFSARQLIFGTHQVTFRCTEGKSCESLTSPLKVGAFPKGQNGARSRSVWEHITQYSQRELTFDSDVLNAITAMFRAYNNKNGEVAFQAWGIPFAGCLSALNGLSPGPLKRAIFSSEQAIFGYSLAWYSTHSSLRRRCDLPTWSWASCNGSVGFMSLPFGTPDSAVIPDPEVDIWLEYNDGELAPLANYLSHGSTSQPSQYLHIEAWSVRSGLTFHPDEGRVTIDVGDEKYHLTANISMDTLPDEHDQKPVRDVLMGKEGWEAIVVYFSPEDNNDSVQPFIITLVRIDDPIKPHDDVFERIGHITDLRLEKISKKAEISVQNFTHDVLGREGIPIVEPETSPQTVGWAAKALKDQARETRQAEETFMKFREGLRQVDQPPQHSAVSSKTWDATEGSDLHGHAPCVDTHQSLYQTAKSNLAFKEVGAKALRQENSASAPREFRLPVGKLGNALDFLKSDEAANDGEGELQGQPDSRTNELGVVTHTIDTSSSSESDSDDHEDYMINMIVRRGHIKRLFPRIPMARRRLIIK